MQRHGTEDSKELDPLPSSCDNRINKNDYQLFNTLDTNGV